VRLELGHVLGSHRRRIARNAPRETQHRLLRRRQQRLDAAFRHADDLFVSEELAQHAPVPRREIALPAGSPYGTIAVDHDACTMCLACVGACPEGAILDNPEALELRFIEAKCVQCGICAKTCPEDAIALAPRLNLAPEARQPRIVNEAAIFKCIACGKALGPEKMIANMLGRLAGHSMFTVPGALDRLKMCADCRVIDLMKNERGVDIRDV